MANVIRYGQLKCVKLSARRPPVAAPAGKPMPPFTLLCMFECRQLPTVPPTLRLKWPLYEHRETAAWGMGAARGGCADGLKGNPASCRSPRRSNGARVGSGCGLRRGRDRPVSGPAEGLHLTGLAMLGFGNHYPLRLQISYSARNAALASSSDIAYPEGINPSSSQTLR
jgi:hypothetical protein